MLLRHAAAALSVMWWALPDAAAQPDVAPRDKPPQAVAKAPQGQAAGRQQPSDPEAEATEAADSEGRDGAEAADSDAEEIAPVDPELAPSYERGRQGEAHEARGWEKPLGDEPEDWALALPRAIATVPRAVGVAALAPLRGTASVVDRHHLIERVKAIFYNEEETAAILPVLTFGGDQGFTAGVDAFHEGLGSHEERISVGARWGGQYTQAYDVELTANRAAGTRLWIKSLARYQAQPKLWFYGYGPGDEREVPTGGDLGPRDAHTATQFRHERVLALLRLGYTFGEPGATVQVGGTGMFNSHQFGRPQSASEVDIGKIYDTARIPGFDDGATLGEINANVVVDTRDRKGATSSGLYLDAFGGGAPPQGRWRFGHYGLEATGYLDLYRGDRVLVLRAVHEAVIGDEARIPFSDMPRLGGTRRLRGYRFHRFRDKTTALATVEYHYPIHEILSGSLFVDAGHVAPDYENVVDVRDWSLSGGAGFIIRQQDSMILTVEAAYGDRFQLLVTTDPLRAFEDRGESL